MARIKNANTSDTVDPDRQSGWPNVIPEFKKSFSDEELVHRQRDFTIDKVLQSRIVQYGCTHEEAIAKTQHTDFGILSPFARVEVAIFALDDFAKTGRKSALAAATPEAIRGLLGSHFMSQLEATDGRILEIPNYKYEHRYNVKTGVNDVVKTALTFISDDLVNRFLEVICLYASHGCLPSLNDGRLCRPLYSVTIADPMAADPFDPVMYPRLRQWCTRIASGFLVSVHDWERENKIGMSRLLPGDITHAYLGLGEYAQENSAWCGSYVILMARHFLSRTVFAIKDAEMHLRAPLTAFEAITGWFLELPKTTRENGIPFKGTVGVMSEVSKYQLEKTRVDKGYPVFTIDPPVYEALLPDNVKTPIPYASTELDLAVVMPEVTKPVFSKSPITLDSSRENSQTGNRTSDQGNEKPGDGNTQGPSSSPGVREIPVTHEKSSFDSSAVLTSTPHVAQEARKRGILKRSSCETGSSDDVFEKLLYVKARDEIAKTTLAQDIRATRELLHSLWVFGMDVSDEQLQRLEQRAAVLEKSADREIFATEMVFMNQTLQKLQDKQDNLKSQREILIAMPPPQVANHLERENQELKYKLADINVRRENEKRGFAKTIQEKDMAIRRLSEQMIGALAQQIEVPPNAKTIPSVRFLFDTTVEDSTMDISGQSDKEIAKTELLAKQLEFEGLQAKIARTAGAKAIEDASPIAQKLKQKPENEETEDAKPQKKKKKKKAETEEREDDEEIPKTEVEIPKGHEKTKSKKKKKDKSKEREDANPENVKPESGKGKKDKSKDREDENPENEKPTTKDKSKEKEDKDGTTKTKKTKSKEKVVKPKVRQDEKTDEKTTDKKTKSKEPPIKEKDVKTDKKTKSAETDAKTDENEISDLPADMDMFLIVDSLAEDADDVAPENVAHGNLILSDEQMQDMDLSAISTKLFDGERKCDSGNPVGRAKAYYNGISGGSNIATTIGNIRKRFGGPLFDKRFETDVNTDLFAITRFPMFAELLTMQRYCMLHDIAIPPIQVLGPKPIGPTQMIVKTVPNERPPRMASAKKDYGVNSARYVWLVVDEKTKEDENKEREKMKSRGQSQTPKTGKRGRSSSGSEERDKTKKKLKFEREDDDDEKTASDDESEDENAMNVIINVKTERNESDEDAKSEKSDSGTDDSEQDSSASEEEDEEEQEEA